MPPARTHSAHESYLVGNVDVLLHNPVIAEQTVKAKINFILVLSS